MARNNFSSFRMRQSQPVTAEIETSRGVNSAKGKRLSAKPNSPGSHWRSVAIAAASSLAAIALTQFVPSFARADTLYWDANGTTAGITDGAGAWLTANQWYSFASTP